MNETPPKILIIQTAFIGDVVLATSLLEQVKKYFPGFQIDFLLREGNQVLLKDDPTLEEVLVWKKKGQKWSNLISLIAKVQNKKYRFVFNIQRFFSSGLVTVLSGAQYKIGFRPNPLSALFTRAVEHHIPMPKNGDFYHEVQRNFSLLQTVKPELSMPKAKDIPPKLFVDKIELDPSINLEKNFIALAPFSVWETKQWPLEYWLELIRSLSKESQVVIIGGPDEFIRAKGMVKDLGANEKTVINLCGQVNLIESVKVISKARLVVANDSGPTHFASSVNTPVVTIFCSTLSQFGFGPLSKKSKVVEVGEMNCRPCGVHGKRSCPLSHFECAKLLKPEHILAAISEIL